MQVENFFAEGDEVFAVYEGEGKVILYIEEGKSRMYKLRRTKTKGMGVLTDKEFAEDDLSLTTLTTESK